MESKEHIIFNISHTVMGVYFQNKFNVAAIFELMPCLPIQGYVPKTGTFPYFSIPNTIISMNYNGRTRGITKKTSGGTGSIPHMLFLNFQSHGKNIHIKLSGCNYHITGAKTQTLGIEVSYLFSSLLVHIDSIWKKFFMLTQADRYKLLYDVLELLTLTDGVQSRLLMFDEQLAYDRFLDLSDEYDDYKDLIKQIMLFTYEHPTVELFMNKLNMISMINPCEYCVFFMGPKLYAFYSPIYLGVYNYKFPFNMFLPDIAKILQNRNYTASYTNIKNNQTIYIIIPVYEQNKKNNTMSLKKKSSKVDDKDIHTIEIISNGSVSQKSPSSYAEAYWIFEKIRNEIYSIVFPMQDNKQDIDFTMEHF